jgi:2-polyprenyl-3-methyl-5-hydroxy-6-metoxy-1,4-benzoquinol methylase
MNTDFWNDRYSDSEYVYGIEPSKLLKEQLEALKPGKILFPAEGEGRNAVYAAGLGWNVVAFDQSEEGKKKALVLAKNKSVTIDYRIQSFDSIFFEPDSFDALVLVFVHLPSKPRTQFFRKLLSYVKSGGTVILEGFSKNQLKYSSGGPTDEAMLYSIAEILSDFEGVDISLLEEKVVVLKEGPFHDGEASVIHFVGKKK